MKEDLRWLAICVVCMVVAVVGLALYGLAWTWCWINRRLT